MGFRAGCGGVGVLVGVQEVMAPPTPELPVSPLAPVPGTMGPDFMLTINEGMCQIVRDVGTFSPTGVGAGSLGAAAGVVEAVVPAGIPPIDLGSGSKPSHAFDVNGTGTVTGFVTVAGRMRAAIWPNGSTMWTQLPVVADSSVAYQINDSNQVVGVQWTANVPRAFLVSGGVTVLLPLVDGFNGSTAFAINEYGQVAGVLTNSAPFRAVGFLWTPDVPNGTTGTYTLLGEDVGGYTAAYGINERGDVVGEIGDFTAAGVVGSRGAFVWTASAPNAVTGTLENIGVPPGTWMATARAINDHGEVVGNAVGTTMVSGRYPSLAFHWSPGSGFTIIPAPEGGAGGGGRISYAYDISNGGTVVGFVATENLFYELRAYSWRPSDGVMHVYDKLPGTCSSAAFDIDECGVLVGWSLERGTDYSIATRWGECALAVEKAALQEVVEPGEPIRFQITVTNLSTSPATNVRLEDPLPAGPGLSWILESPIPDGCTITGAAPNQALVCEFPELGAGGDSRTVTIRSETTAASCGTYQNIAGVTADHHQPASDGATVQVTCAPAVQVVKTASAATVQAGQPIAFTIQVENTGSVALQNVAVTDSLPGGSASSGRLPRAVTRGAPSPASRRRS